MARQRSEGVAQSRQSAKPRPAPRTAAHPKGPTNTHERSPDPRHHRHRQRHRGRAGPRRRRLFVRTRPGQGRHAADRRRAKRKRSTPPWARASRAPAAPPPTPAPSPPRSAPASATSARSRRTRSGEVFAHDIRAAGVHFPTPPLDGGAPTARCLILVTPDGQRTMNTFLGAAVHFAEADADAAEVGRAGILYLEGYLFDPPAAQAAFRAAARAAHAAGRRVALTLSDPFCVHRHRDAFREFVRTEADILFANEAEILALYETEDFAEAARPRGGGGGAGRPHPQRARQRPFVRRRPPRDRRRARNGRGHHRRRRRLRRRRAGSARPRPPLARMRPLGFRRGGGGHQPFRRPAAGRSAPDARDRRMTGRRRGTQPKEEPGRADRVAPHERPFACPIRAQEKGNVP